MRASLLVVLLPTPLALSFVTPVRRLNDRLRISILCPPLSAEKKDGSFNSDNTLLYTEVNDLESVIAPIYITIGPPCSGKTEALRSCLLSDGFDPDVVFTKDVALSDQSRVYHKVPIISFLFPSTKLNRHSGRTLLKSGSTLRERLFDPNFAQTDQEIKNIILRIAGRLTPQEFAERIKRQAREAGDTVKFFKDRRAAVAEDFILATEEVHLQAVSEVICRVHFNLTNENVEKDDDDHDHDDELPYDDNDKEGSNNAKSTNNTTNHRKEKEEDSNEIITKMVPNNITNLTKVELLSARDLIKTPHVDIFVPHAIFNGGLKRADQTFNELLQKTSSNQPISWGNTNTRPSEYVNALKAAEKCGRPVKFISWGSRLERVPRRELLRRNVARFRNSGRYIPAGALAASLGRVQKLVKQAQAEVEGMPMSSSSIDASPPVTTTEFLAQVAEEENRKMDKALASLAGFRMLENGFVVQTGDAKF